VSLREQVALLRAFGSPERVFSAPPGETATIVGERAASRLLQPPHAKALDAALAWLQTPGHHMLAWDDARYPKLLLETATPPCVLYVRGDPALLSRPAVAIVGSRNASQQGVHDAESFGEALSSAGFAVVSGLARGVLVVEAAVGSGSLITARCAAEQGRDVFAIPGSIHSPLSKGCHRLIRDGAKLVENAADILDEWNCVPFACDDAAVQDAPVKDRMLQAMGHGPVSIDELVARTGSDAGAVAARLSLLELRGAVSAIAGGLFQRLSARTNAAKRVIE
jgi:DNA processing protein